MITLTKSLLHRLVTSGKTQREVAALIGRSQTAVRYWLKKFGIKHKFVYQKHSCKAIEKAVKRNVSYAGVLRTLNISISGASYRYVKKRILESHADTSHFLGQSAGAGARCNHFKKPEDVLIAGDSRTVAKQLRRSMLAIGVEMKCAVCHLTTWQDKPIRLQIDHINGDRTDNRRDNLRFLCPNCHSQTPTYGHTRNQVPMAALRQSAVE